MKKLCCLLCILCLVGKTQIPSFALYCPSGSTTNAVTAYTLTCATPSLDFSANCIGGSGPCTFSWVSLSYIASGNSASITVPGVYSVIANSGTVTATQVFTIYANFTAPVSSMSSTFQVVSSTMAPTAITVTAISPTANITHFFYAPTGGTTVASSATIVYLPATQGTYTHCIVDDNNGCSSCQPFIISIGSPATVGVTKITDEKSTFLIYPNPAKDRIYIKINGDKNDERFCLYNSRGELIRDNIIPDPEKSISIDALPDGIYMLQLKDADSHVKCRRFIVSK